MQIHCRARRCLSLALHDLALHAVEGRETKHKVFEHDGTTVISLTFPAADTPSSDIYNHISVFPYH